MCSIPRIVYVLTTSSATRAGPADEAGAHRQDALELHRAVQAHEPREHVDPGFRELREEDGLAVEPFRHTDAPALHRDAAREGAAHRRQCLGPVGELRLHLERDGLVDRRNLPQDVVGLAVYLCELQVARLELVRASRCDRGKQQRHSHEQAESVLTRPSAPCSLDADLISARILARSCMRAAPVFPFARDLLAYRGKLRHSGRRASETRT